MEKKKIVILFLFLIGVMIVVALAVFVLKTRATYKTDVARKYGNGVPVKTTTVKLEDVAETLGGNFLVVPDSIVNIYSLISSQRVKDVKTDIGKMVKAKQVLMALDDTLVLTALKAAEAQMRMAETLMENNKVQYNRIAELYSKGYATKLQLEEALLSSETANANYAGALNTLQQAKENAKNVFISVPISGIVTQRKVDLGQSVKAGDLLLTIANIDSIMVETSIAEEKVDRVFSGQDADIIFDSFPNLNVAGKVYKIDPSTDPISRTFKVSMKVQNKDYKFKPGLAGYARLTFHFKGLVIPPLALIKNQKEFTVFVVENKKAHIRRIRVGMEAYDKIEVVDGLKEGEEIVYYGQLDLKDGDTVNTEAYKN